MEDTYYLIIDGEVVALGESEADLINQAYADGIEKFDVLLREDIKDGHEALMADALLLWTEAKTKQFHDFENTAYDAPKMALMAKLGVMAKRVEGGQYDN